MSYKQDGDIVFLGKPLQLIGKHTLRGGFIFLIRDDSHQVIHNEQLYAVTSHGGGKHLQHGIRLVAI